MSADNGNGLVRRFFQVANETPLGRLAQHRCVSLSAALIRGEPVTPEIMVDWIEAHMVLLRQSQYVTADAAITMEFDAARPLLKRLGEAMKSEE